MVSGVGFTTLYRPEKFASSAFDSEKYENYYFVTKYRIPDFL